MIVIAPADIPRVKPPTPRKNTINTTLKSPVDMPNESAIPDITPPSMLLDKFLCIGNVFKTLN